VFVPISFLPSSAGRLFAEFGFVMAIAVALSSFVALSLGPMIASRLPQQTAAGPLWRRLSQGGRSATTAYGRLLAACLRPGAWLMLACLALAAGAAVLYTQLNQELTPTEDRGVLSIRLDGPDGVGLTYSDDQLEQALALVTPLQQQGLVQNIYTITGFYDLNRAYIVAPLADWGQRSLTQAELSARLQRQLDGLPGVRVRIRSGNSLGVGGGDGSVQMAITGDNYTRIAEAAYAFAETIERELPALRDVRVNYAATQPQLTMQVDRQRAAELGVPIAGLDTVLRALVDGTEVAELTVDDRSVPVMLESARRGATQPQDLLALQVRAADGRLVSLAQFVRFDETAIPAELQRLGQRRAVGMSAVTVSGVPLQQAVDGLRALAVRELPDGMGLILRGDAATLEQTGRDVNLTFGIALLVVFLVLVAQFEGVSSAAVVLISVPFGLAAAVFAMTLSGTSLNIYTQIGLLLLVGVMAKNSILMVEFADQLRDAGRSVHEAALESARLRLRPIVMTMASTVLGALPLVLGSGPGAESRAAIGWVIFGGLSLAAFFTLFLTPVLYLGLARFSKPRANQGERLAREMQAAADAGAQEIV
jgi:hydrophobic/amphiphilic exporter-1 (mainly G- bacteria), HAE1 family